MLLGIWGPFAVGKTTFLNSFMAARAGNPAFKSTVFVFADLCMEYRMDRHGQWRETILKGSHWNGKQVDKERYIHDMIADDSQTWVVESARYFSGMYECLVDAHNLCEGGLRFVIPITDGPTMIKFMQARCDLRGKEFRADYWDADRVAYEADGRYTNAAVKWFKPNGISYQVVMVDESRKQFANIGGILNTWLQRPADEWYGADKIESTKFWYQVPTKQEGVERRGRH